MISKPSQRNLITEMGAENGKGKLVLDKLITEPDFQKKIRTYAKAVLEPGASVGYHVHHGESESYFILSGTGEYNNNGILENVSCGDVTFTPSGEGHAIKNIGTDTLEFIALIVLD